MENTEIQLFISKYKQEYNIYERFCDYLEKQFKELIKETDVYYYELSSRIKTLDSILEKMERKSLPLQDIHDIIGFRIITLFKRDVCTICDMVRNTFQISWEDDKAQEKTDNCFGYLSIHFQLKVPEEWIKSPTDSQYSKLDVELQVRTFSQHVWAASSHLLQYKRDSSVPYVMRRNINRLAAVLEIVDDELESILNAKECYRLSLQETSNNEKECSETTLNSILLEHILDELFLKENKKLQEPFDDLLEELSFCGINTVGQLRELLSSEMEGIRKKEAKKSGEKGEPFYSYAGKLRLAMKSRFPVLYKKMRNPNK